MIIISDFSYVLFGFQGDGLQNTGCFNAVCPGYVQVSQKRIMGEANHPVTVPGVDVYAMEFKIFRVIILHTFY